MSMFMLTLHDLRHSYVFDKVTGNELEDNIFSLIESKCKGSLHTNHVIINCLSDIFFLCLECRSKGSKKNKQFGKLLYHVYKEVCLKYDIRYDVTFELNKFARTLEFWGIVHTSKDFRKMLNEILINDLILITALDKRFYEAFDEQLLAYKLL